MAAETREELAAIALYNVSSVYPGITNETINIAHHVEYTDPEILAVLAMGSIGFILNIAGIRSIDWLIDWLILVF